MIWPFSWFSDLSNSLRKLASASDLTVQELWDIKNEVSRFLAERDVKCHQQWMILYKAGLTKMVPNPSGEIGTPTQNTWVSYHCP